MTTSSSCINNSCVALPNQHVRLLKQEHKHGRSPAPCIHRADIDMHERARLHVLDAHRPSETHKRTFSLPSYWLLCASPRGGKRAIHHIGCTGRKITHISPNHGQIALDGSHIWEIAAAFSLHTNDKSPPLNFPSPWLRESDESATDRGGGTRGENATDASRPVMEFTNSREKINKSYLVHIQRRD